MLTLYTIDQMYCCCMCGSLLSLCKYRLFLRVCILTELNFLS